MKVIQDTKLNWDGSEWVYSPFPWDATLQEAKDLMVSFVQLQIYNILQPSDWMVVRKVETNKPLPAEWESWRGAIRSCAQDKIELITECKSKKRLLHVTTSENFLEWPDHPSS